MFMQPGPILVHGKVGERWTTSPMERLRPVLESVPLIAQDDRSELEREIDTLKEQGLNRMARLLEADLPAKVVDPAILFDAGEVRCQPFSFPIAGTPREYVGRHVRGDWGLNGQHRADLNGDERWAPVLLPINVQNAVVVATGSGLVIFRFNVHDPAHALPRTEPAASGRNPVHSRPTDELWIVSR